MPPPGLVDEVARGLRRVLGLHLFNFDMIRGRKAAGGGGQYFIIDINYFSGFDKLPGYEVALTDFFDEMIRSPHTGSGRFYRRRNASKLFCGEVMATPQQPSLFDCDTGVSVSILVADHEMEIMQL
ncbi:inositol-tetrakisphosphate 1-kinase 4-like [Lolium perenne]|uniref:inositol-tetrakisphosphate 1-kinase 4-like n=1 Tax=Lolium perenne TaxID=4522 RepID=UPI003A99206C